MIAIDVVTWINFGNHNRWVTLHYKLKAKQQQEESGQDAGERLALGAEVVAVVTLIGRGLCP